MPLNDWLFDTQQYLRRMRMNLESMETSQIQQLIKAISSTSTPEDERKQLTDMLVELKQNKNDMP